jgi:inorganic pyrophosphatase
VSPLGNLHEGAPDPDSDRFWVLADQLVRDHRIVIDRPAGSRHPRVPDIVYPFDYGYLEGTGAVDGDGVDCWRGSLPDAIVTGAVVTVDVIKADSEVKWLVGCTGEEMQAALATHRTAWQAALLLVRDRDAR